MEENRNESFEEQTENTVEHTEVSFEEIAEVQAQKPKRDFRALKKGSYSAAVTAIFLAALILVNVLVSVLGEKVNLEFDMTSEKISSITKENEEYLKGVDKKVSITFCADSYNYSNGIMDSYAEASSIYGGTEYYKQTVKLIEKYAEINENITVSFVDTQDSAFAAITAKYPNESINYGDIIVSVGEGENERYQKLGFTDIYSVEYNEEYASYGYTMYSVMGSNLETKLSGAIEYAISGKTVKFAVLSGHSKTDYTEDYISMLEQNNHSVEVVDSSLITNISSEYDAIIIAAPTVDFAPEEISAIEKFLDNDGKLGKGLIYFADATVPVLPNLTAFLAEWGIGVSEGILFETDSNNYMPEMPTAMGMYPDAESELTANMNIFCTGCNVPLKVVDTDDESITATSLITSTDTVVAAPLGTSDGWSGAGEYEAASYSGLIEASRSGDDTENVSYVYAFGSAEYIHSQWTQYSNFSNLDVALNVAENAGGVSDSGISFVTKTITNENFKDKVSESTASTVRVIFVFLLPVGILALGIYIFIRRKNA